MPSPAMGQKAEKAEEMRVKSIGFHEKQRMRTGLYYRRGNDIGASADRLIGVEA